MPIAMPEKVSFHSRTVRTERKEKRKRSSNTRRREGRRDFGIHVETVSLRLNKVAPREKEGLSLGLVYFSVNRGGKKKVWSNVEKP